MSKTKMETAVAKKEEAEIMVPLELGGADWYRNVEAKDFLIERVGLAQPLSDAVTSGDIKPGQFYKIGDHTFLGDSKSPFLILLVDFNKNWIIERQEGGRYEYESIQPYFPKDANLPWDFKEDGKTKRRNESFNFFVLPMGGLAEGERFPILISFRRTAISCAKNIISYMTMMRSMKAPPCMHVLELTSIFKDSDKGKYYIPEMKRGRKATIEEMTLAKKWFDTINAGAVKIAAEEKSSEPVASEESQF